MRKLILFSLILLGASLHPTLLNAQISFGGSPASFNFENYKLNSPVYEAVVDFDVRKLLEEDVEWNNSGNPPRCAKIITVCLNAVDNGEWTTLPDGTWIWHLEIYAPDALAVMLYYDKFIIPQGGKLFLYNPDRTKVLGAYTEKTNTFGAEFATEFVSGDKIILEYTAPEADEMFIPEIEITGVAYGYNYLIVPEGKNSWNTRWGGSSDPCQVNINCPEGDEWQNEKKGIARIISPAGGSYVTMCSGSLINNTACDMDPLFLSAWHCYTGMSEAQMNQTTYYFHFEDPACPRLNTEQIPTVVTLVGAQSLVMIPIQGGSDGALVRLNSAIPEHYDLYMNG